MEKSTPEAFHDKSSWTIINKTQGVFCVDGSQAAAQVSGSVTGVNTEKEIQHLDHTRLQSSQ